MTAAFMPIEDDFDLLGKINKHVYDSIKEERYLQGPNSLNAKISTVYPKEALWLNAARRIVSRLEKKDEEYTEFIVGDNRTRVFYSKKVYEFGNSLAEYLYLYVLKLRKLRKLRESVS